MVDSYIEEFLESGLGYPSFNLLYPPAEMRHWSQLSFMMAADKKWLPPLLQPRNECNDLDYRRILQLRDKLMRSDLMRREQRW
jgi:hypothetical protein